VFCDGRHKAFSCGAANSGLKQALARWRIVKNPLLIQLVALLLLVFRCGPPAALPADILFNRNATSVILFNVLLPTPSYYRHQPKRF
jgi:hypothetical protein